MDKALASIDSKGAQALIERLRPEHYKSVIRATLNKQARKLLKATRDNFAHLVGIKGKDAKRSLTGGASYGTPKDKVGGSKTYVKGRNPFAVVSLRGRRTDFRALFFELGTKQRKTRAGYGRGSISAGYYFRRAQRQTEGSIYREMSSDLRAIIDRKVRRYGK